MRNQNTVEFRQARAASNKKAIEEAFKMSPEAWNHTRRGSIPQNTQRGALKAAEDFRQKVAAQADLFRHGLAWEDSEVPSVEELELLYNQAREKALGEEAIRHCAIQLEARRQVEEQN